MEMEMKKLVLLMFFAAGAASAAEASAPAITQAQQLAQIDIHLMQLQETLLKAPQKDAKAFCYQDDKAFSEGAVSNGLTCRRTSNPNVFEKAEQTLFWDFKK